MTSTNKSVWNSVSDSVYSYVWTSAWNSVEQKLRAGATLSTDIYFHADRDLRKTITENTNKLRRALLPKLYEYNFTK